MIITIAKSFMFWKYRWVKIILSDGTRLHGVVPIKSDLFNLRSLVK